MSERKHYDCRFCGKSIYSDGTYWRTNAQPVGARCKMAMYHAPTLPGRGSEPVR